MVHKMKKKKVGGFTLIELIVVIAILGILAAIVAPRLMGFQDTAKIAADDALMETANKALMLLHATGEDLPTTTDLEEVIEFLAGADVNMLESNAKFNFPENYSYAAGDEDTNIEQGIAITKD